MGLTDLKLQQKRNLITSQKRQIRCWKPESNCFYLGGRDMQEWYLLSQNTRPNVTGGFENDMFVENKDDAFAESLETDIAVSVILYNSDLSKGKNIRCIVQGNTADTQLKSLERTVLFFYRNCKSWNVCIF